MNPLFKPTSYSKGAALAVGATFAWKFISFLNALLLAAYFGATYHTDLYFYLIMVLGFGVAFVQRLNQTVLLPEALFLHEQSADSARRFLMMWLYIYTLLCMVCGGLGTVFSLHIWGWMSRFTPQELAGQQLLLILGAWWFGLQLVSYYLQTIADLFKYFAAAWLGVLNALLPLVCLFTFGRQVGLSAMLYGFIAANIIQIGILLVLCKKQLGFSLAPAWHPVPLRARQNILAGQSLAVLDIVNSLLPVYLMSGLNAGVITALNYCRQFTDSATEIFTARTANVVKIQLTEDAAKQQQNRLQLHFLTATQVLILLLAPLTVFSCYFAPQIVELFFERGEFTPQATRQTVFFLRPMLWVMLLTAAGYLQNSAIVACRKIKESFPYALAAGLFLTGLLAWFIPRCGAFSYPYLLGAGLLAGFLFNAVFFRQHLPFCAYQKHLWVTLRLSGLAAIALLPAIGLSKLLPSHCFWQIIGCGIVFVGIYGLLVRLSGDLQSLRDFFRNNL